MLIIYSISLTLELKKNSCSEMKNSMTGGEVHCALEERCFFFRGRRVTCR